MQDPSSIPGYASRYATNVEKTLDVVPQLFGQVLTAASGLAKSEQAAHVTRVRDEAYEHCPYPCIGNFRFLGLDLSAHPAYQEHVLAPLKADPAAGEVEPVFLDVGTCFGQDVRKLIFDGARQDRLWASDVRQSLIDCGFKMFKDEHKLDRSRFLCPGDMLADSPDDKLVALHDKVTILHITTVFHLFSLPQQEKVARNCLRLLKKDIPASSGRPSLILGGQTGTPVAGNFVRNKSAEFSHMFRHNVQSWQELWQRVAAEPQWKDRIKTLDVKSRLVKRVPDAETGTISFPEPTERDLSEQGMILWHQFEVRVQFNS